MPYNLATTMGGLFGFLRRYGGIIEEIIEAIGGFTTLTEGVYNPVMFPNRWRNTQEDPFTKTDFEFYYKTPLSVISNKERNKKFKLKINCAQIPLYYKDNLQIRQEVGVSGFTAINIIKQCLAKEKLKKLHILSKITGQSELESLTIKTGMYSRDYTPISVKIWIKRNLMSKLGVLSLVNDFDITRVTDSTYIVDDVGNISDIEMIEMIGDINAI
jgi:hypothetical protein